MKIGDVLNAKPESGVVTITPDAGVRELSPSWQSTTSAP